MTADTRSGFIAVVGAPNVGKSTLVNRLVGTKVTIVSPKVQTTRVRVLGICMAGRTQLVFIDTPGIFRPRRRLDRAMVAAAWEGVAAADRTLLLVDAARGLDADTRRIIERHGYGNAPLLLAINKVDLVRKPDLLTLAQALNREGTFERSFMISARTGSGVDDLLDYLARTMPEGPWHFPEDQVSDMPLRLLAAEITREQLYLQLHRELPYAAAVETETWEEGEDGSVTIRQIVYIERPSQKAIVLGKRGRRIKSLGETARKELEAILERRVHLFLFVKVRENWSEDPERYRDLGLDFNA
ncbi:MAG: GTPase Era [Proteobacteria bacterium]|nr:GTPase Era [Pseudomonadota bacterium]